MCTRSIKMPARAFLLTVFCLSVSAEELRPPPEFAESSGALQRFEIAQEELAARPNDADALAQVGSSYRELGDPVNAAQLYRQAAEAALRDDRIRFTRELSELYVETRDLPGLKDTFSLFVNVDSGGNPSDKYLAMVDFADGLASLDDESAWAVFEEALLLADNNIEAINRYSTHLLAKYRYGECLEVLDRLTPQQRARSVMPTHIYRECEIELGKAGDDTTRSNGAFRRRVDAQFGVVIQEPFNPAKGEELPK